MGILYDSRTNTTKFLCRPFRVKQLWRILGRLSCNSGEKRLIVMTCMSRRPCMLKENTSEIHLAVTKVSPFFSVPVWAMGPGTM